MDYCALSYDVISVGLCITPSAGAHILRFFKIFLKGDEG